MTRIVAIANIKGGAGKTTSTFALGEALAHRGHRVCLVDLDPQAALTNSAGVFIAAKDGTPTIYSALVHYSRERVAMPLEQYRRPIAERLDLLPASLDLDKSSDELYSAKRREYLLMEVLLPARTVYDVVLIDCPPSSGFLLTNALTGAHEVVIPTPTEYLAVRGLALLFDKINEIRVTDLNKELTVAGLILTMADDRTMHSREMEQELRGLEDVPVLGKVRRATRVNEAPRYGQSVWRLLAGTPVAEAYQAIADGLLQRWGIAAERASAAR
jgi:chromosome partitioning protein